MEKQNHKKDLWEIYRENYNVRTVVAEAVRRLEKKDEMIEFLKKELEKHK